MSSHSTHGILLTPGTLWDNIIATTQHALKTGALQPIHTQQYRVKDSDVPFLIRTVTSLKRKEKQKQQTFISTQRINPFLPYEQDLFVTDVSNTHLALLNKFNVIDYHLLIVTRQFEHQERLLSKNDIAALHACTEQYPSLAFYNGGVAAGASQTHKHLQLIPLPSLENSHSLPIEFAFADDEIKNGTVTDCGLPFRHALIKFDLFALGDFEHVVNTLIKYYHSLLNSVGVFSVSKNGRAFQSLPYNLLVTNEWMMVVPRSQEFFRNISINALGFAGSLFVRDSNQLDQIIHVGPMNVLKSVSIVDT